MVLKVLRRESNLVLVKNRIASLERRSLEKWKSLRLFVLYGRPVYVDRQRIRSNLKIISLEHGRQIADVLFIHKILNNNIDCLELTNFITLRIPSHSTRNNYTFITHQALTNYFLNSPAHRITNTYNKLSSIVEMDIFYHSADLIKKLLKYYF